MTERNNKQTSGLQPSLPPRYDQTYFLVYTYLLSYLEPVLQTKLGEES